MQAEQLIPTEILQRPKDGVTGNTRQALKNVGPLSDDDSPNGLKGTPHSTEVVHYGSNRGDTSNRDVTTANEESNKDLAKNCTESENHMESEPTPSASRGKKHKYKGTEDQSKQGVITTPTKNRFDALDTESELQRAFRNLQDPPQSLPLITIPEDQEKYFSDGSGTRSKSNMGIPRPRTEPNSDEEDVGAQDNLKDTVGSPNR